MILYQLMALPTRQTLDYLSRVFSGCPFDVDLSQCFVEINTSAEPMVAQPHNVYACACTDLNVYYDAHLGTSSLILGLDSMAMTQRFVGLQQSAPHKWHTEFHAHMTVVEPMPSLPRHFRAFINSVASTLINNDQALLFDAEMVVPIDVNKPSDMEYYKTRNAVTTLRRSLEQF